MFGGLLPRMTLCTKWILGPAAHERAAGQARLN